MKERSRGFNHGKDQTETDSSEARHFSKREVPQDEVNTEVREDLRVMARRRKQGTSGRKGKSEKGIKKSTHFAYPRSCL